MSDSQPPAVAPTDLPESRLYTLIDEPREFAIYFLEGQRLIHDLALIHNLRGAGFSYFRDVVLSVQPLIALLKHGEQLGFYIDSEIPYFRLKVETGHHGATRSMLIPDAFDQFPESLTGLVRLQKLFPRNRPPYQSILQVEAEPFDSIVNRVLGDSYQINSALFVSQTSDQSMLLHQLPPIREDEYDYSLEAAHRKRDKLADSVQRIFEQGLVESDALVEAFSTIGFRALASRSVRFECHCSQQRVLMGLLPIYRENPDNLFEADRDDLQVTCEYCKSRYEVRRQDLEAAGHPVN